MWILSGDKVILSGPLVGVTVDWVTRYSSFNAAERALYRITGDKGELVQELKQLSDKRRDLSGRWYILKNLRIHEE